MTNTDPRCAKCGHKRSQHNYRHPFVGPSVQDTIEAMQADIKVMVDGLVVSQNLLEAYSRQKYPSDNPTHKRYRKCDYDANPARMALALINKDTNPE